MSNRTWACVECKQKYRRDQNSDMPVKCAICGKECECVHWKIRVPSPKRENKWNKFWTQYFIEKNQLNRFHAGKLNEEATLEIHNMKLLPNEKSIEKYILEISGKKTL